MILEIDNENKSYIGISIIYDNPHFDGLKIEKSYMINAPRWNIMPIAIECKVRKSEKYEPIEAEIINVSVESELVRENDETINMEKTLGVASFASVNRSKE